jgi:GNAT superfamily N-acetyltransferase
MAERWPDLEALFGKRGAYSGCWCMYWRTTRSKFTAQSGEGNRLALKAIVESKQPTGILAYVDGQPAGWCSVAPRESYPSLQRSRTLKPVDGQPVWAIVCFFVAKPHRGRGLMGQLVKAAVDYAASQGARIVEAYPEERPESKDLKGYDGYMGLAPVFRKAGFVEVARRSEHHPIMRLYLDR